LQKTRLFFCYFKKYAYLRTDFFVMSVDFRQLTTDLQTLTGQLKHRCLEAEERVASLEHQLEELQLYVAQLEAEKSDIETKYHNLQSGMAATGNDPAQVARLKEQYLAMVSEIDACITLLQNG